jgi:membrane-associated phospholipid phosphatase
VAPAILAYVFWKARWKGLAIFAGAIILSGGVDNLINIIKPIFNRVRPFANNELPFEVIFRGSPQGGLSFPSGHAADGFFIAVFLGLYFPKMRWFFIALATMTAYSRIYCGVHYPSDVVAGALMGTALAFLSYFVINKIRQIQQVQKSKKTKVANLKNFAFVATILYSFSSFGYQDPTHGKPFFPWLWEDQFKPTIVNGFDQNGLGLLAVGALTTAAAHQYDYDVVDHNVRNPDALMSQDTASQFAKLGSGVLGVSVALGQVVYDQENGLMHARAIALTTISHVSLAFMFQRNRPNGRGDYLPFPSAFPSGHTSSAFASAGALTYAYGWKVGVPVYTLATVIAASRIAESAHWLSDITAGIALGTFWARASYLSHTLPNTELSWMPVPIEDGLGIYYQHRF